MVNAKFHGLMEAFIVEKMQTCIKTAKGPLNGMTETVILGTLLITSWMEKENSNEKTEMFILANGKRMKCTEKEFLNEKMGKSMKGSIRKD